MLPLILIVDDQDAISQTLTSQLSDSFDVIVEKSGQDAMLFCDQHSPDLILMDVRMPKMSGIEVCKYLKQSEQLCHIPVIFLTGAECFETEKACWDAGCIDFLSKPVCSTILFELINAHLNMKNKLNNLTKNSADQIMRNKQSSDWHTGLLGIPDTIDIHHKMNLSLVVLQISKIDKVINCRGWVKKDEYISAMLNAITSQLPRSVDIVVRYQQDKFLCILPGSGPEAARHFAFMLSRAISRFVSEGLNERAPNLIMLSGITKSDKQFDTQAMLQEAETRLDSQESCDVGHLAARKYDNNETVTQTITAQLHA